MQRNCPSCWGTGRLTCCPFDEAGKDPQSHALIYGRPCYECGGSGVERPIAVVPRLRGIVPWDDVVALLIVGLAVLIASAVALSVALAWG